MEEISTVDGFMTKGLNDYLEKCKGRYLKKRRLMMSDSDGKYAKKFLQENKYVIVIKGTYTEEEIKKVASLWYYSTGWVALEASDYIDQYELTEEVDYSSFCKIENVYMDKDYKVETTTVYGLDELKYILDYPIVLDEDIDGGQGYTIFQAPVKIALAVYKTS